MEKGMFVYHRNDPGMLLKVVSPASSNGGTLMVCEAVQGLTIHIVRGAPEYFYPAANQPL